MFKRTLILSAALTAFAATPALASEATLTIENFVGKIKLETGSKLKVTTKKNSGDVDFDSSSGNLIIDGGISEPNGDDCKGYYGRGSWSFFSKKEKQSDFGGYKDLDDYPNLTISVPEDTKLVIRNSIPFGTVSDIGSADIEMSSCGNLKLGDVNGPTLFDIRGSGDITAGNLQTLDASVRGSGDVTVGNTTDVKISVRGSGDITLENADNADITVAGSGDVELEDVRSTLTVKSSGSGDVRAQSAGEALFYEGRGSTDFEIETVNGMAEISISGSGDVEIDDGDIETLIISARGSSQVEFGGSAQNAELTASGASDIYVDKIIGKSETRETGSADIDIGN